MKYRLDYKKYPNGLEVYHLYEEPSSRWMFTLHNHKKIVSMSRIHQISNNIKFLVEHYYDVKFT